MFLLTYFLAGAWKLRDAVMAGLSHESLATILSSLNFHLAHNLIQGATPNPLSNWLLRSHFVSSVAWMAIIYFEFCCLFVIFRHRLTRLWGLAIVFFHLGTLLLMGGAFLPAMLLSAVLLIHSPIRNSKTLPASEVLRDFPGFGWVMGFLE